MNSGTLPAKSEDAADWGVETNAWTLEAWVWMSAFPINNQAIFNAPVSKGTEIYIRFGDANEMQMSIMTSFRSRHTARSSTAIPHLNLKHGIMLHSYAATESA